MSDLGPLFASPPDPSWLTHPTSVIEWSFRRFHDANPIVYDQLERAALAWASTSPDRIGVKRLIENMRYSPIQLSSTPFQPFKLNDHHTALYARLLIHRHPRLVGVIETRRRKEDGASAA